VQRGHSFSGGLQEAFGAEDRELFGGVIRLESVFILDNLREPS